MRGQRIGLAASLLLALASPADAEPGRNAQPLDWLVRMAQSAQMLNYAGTYIFTHDGRAETSRVVHINDGSSEHARIQALDGPPREIIRESGVLYCYLPDSHVVKVDRSEGRQYFPALFSGSPTMLREYYNVNYAGMDRVAGRECQIVQLEPRDGMRFGYRLCADIQTGLMLRATLEDGTRGVMQQFAFTEIDGSASRTALQPSWNADGWLWDRSGMSQTADSGWSMDAMPPGFHKISELLRRSADGRSVQVKQAVYSDGISAVSLFIEPARGNAGEAAATRRGALSFYSIRSGDQQVTAIGEVPPANVTQMVKAVNLVKSKP
ncbi:MAG: MucB/RseB C-terminal domain-containing protein [Pseudomonadota bacterium]|nr:MucB/RseB C-terminal domain-containing protein [Pseudomonadota bacterium]